MSTPPTIHQNVVPSEVGWQFVPQYYTYVNKQPNRLHCFYTKTSTFIHGTEGEDVKACFGQQVSFFFFLSSFPVVSCSRVSTIQEIHNKITSIGFQDCKVFIHSVDAQSSANGGIIIQVIGEMSNHGDPWRKFVQTFFLAEQPNGYFVLNDIFRFLKEDTVEDDVSEAESAPAVSVPEPAPVDEPGPEFVVEPSPSPPPREPTPPPAPPVLEEEPAIVEPGPPTPPPAAETQVVEPNGVHEEPEPEPEPAPVVPSEPEPVPEASPEPEPAPAPQPQAPPAASPTPPPAPAQQPPAPAPAPVKSAPKTWASLAAADSKRWGAQVATESKGLTEVPAASNSPVPTSGTQSPAPHGPPHRGGPQHGSREHPSVANVHALTTPQCFVKVYISYLFTMNCD